MMLETTPVLFLKYTWKTHTEDEFRFLFQQHVFLFWIQRRSSSLNFIKTLIYTYFLPVALCTGVYYWHWTSQPSFFLVNLQTSSLEHLALCLSAFGAYVCVWKTWLKITLYDGGSVFSVHLVEANRIRPKGFHVLCSHSPWGNDVKLKEPVSLSEFKVITKDVEADSIRDWFFFV